MTLVVLIKGEVWFSYQDAAIAPGSSSRWDISPEHFGQVSAVKMYGERRKCLTQPPLNSNKADCIKLEAHSEAHCLRCCVEAKNKTSLCIVCRKALFTRSLQADLEQNQHPYTFSRQAQTEFLTAARRRSNGLRCEKSILATSSELSTSARCWDITIAAPSFHMGKWSALYAHIENTSSPVSKVSMVRSIANADQRIAQNQNKNRYALEWLTVLTSWSSSTWATLLGLLSLIEHHWGVACKEHINLVRNPLGK